VHHPAGELNPNNKKTPQAVKATGFFLNWCARKDW
jgi:hypothetical protein